MSSSKLDLENKAKLRSSKQAHQIYKEQDFTDSVYIIEGCYMTYIICRFYKKNLQKFLELGSVGRGWNITSNGKTTTRLHGQLILISSKLHILGT